MDFEWDERKSELNKRRHGIDFQDAGSLLDGRPIVVVESPRGREMRYVATGEFRSRIWSVVFTIRDGSIRII